MGGITWIVPSSACIAAYMYSSWSSLPIATAKSGGPSVDSAMRLTIASRHSPLFTPLSRTSRYLSPLTVTTGNCAWRMRMPSRWLFSSAACSLP